MKVGRYCGKVEDESLREGESAGGGGVKGKHNGESDAVGWVT